MIGASEALEALTAAYDKETDEEVRQEIINALSRIKDKRALPLLRRIVRATKDSDVFHVYAEMAICNIEGTDYEEMRLKRQKQEQRE